MADRGTTMKAGNKFMTISRKVSKSTKISKSPSRVFGTSSQFSGVGTGISGDVRK